MSEPLDTPIPICAAPGCSNRLERTGRRGPWPKYCSEACRQAAFRARRQAHGFLPAVEPCAVELRPEPTDTQVARAVVDAAALAATFARLAIDARPEFAYRCEQMYFAIRLALDEHFDGADR